MRRSVVTWLFGLAAGLWLVACGGGPDLTKANLRLVNASGYAALDMRVDDKLRFEAVAYGASASYEELDPGNIDSVLSQPGSSTPLLSFTPSVNEKKHYSLLAYGREGALKTVLLDDNASAEKGKVRLRVVNAAPDAGSVDAYVTAAGDSLATAVPLQAGAAVGAVGGYTTLAAASWRVRITGAGDKTDLRLDVSDVALTAGKVMTLVLTPTSGGVLVKALLLTQEGSIGSVETTLARVRVAAPNSGMLSVSVAGTALVADAAAPLFQAYQLLEAGPGKPVTVSVNGQQVSVGPVTLAPGSDQTLLIHATGGAVAATWLLDDNSLPTVSGSAKLRLVHGLDGTADPLTLKADFQQVAAGVRVGTASAYGSVTASPNVRVTVTEQGNSTALADLSNQALAVGGVYSVFMVEGSAPDKGIVSRDR